MILQDSIPYDAFSPHRLPGIAPCDPAQWLLFDEAYAAQMAERDRLLSVAREKVLALNGDAMPAAQELLCAVLNFLGHKGGDQYTRDDGVIVPIDANDPLKTVGRLVQDDFCLLDSNGTEHVLTGAVLCFPAGWRLSEKLNRPLVAIHDTVSEYDDQIARRVQRLFDGVQIGRPLWRFNALPYDDPTLFQPFGSQSKEPAPYFRSERQTVLRLPNTRAVVFGIHTYIIRHPKYPEQQR